MEQKGGLGLGLREAALFLRGKDKIRESGRRGRPWP